MVVTARDTKKLEEFEKEFPRTALIVRLDVTDLPSVTEAVRAAKERFGGIDVLVNNAGYGYRAAVEEGNPEGLYLETAPLGIKVMIVEPGAFRTDFAGRSLTQSKTAIADYAGTAGTRRIENDKTHGAQPGDPDKGARLIIEAIEAEDAPLRLLLGSDAVRAADTVLESHKSEYDKWREFSRRSDF